ncbi:MAG: hypothetical protein Hyperionvirus15_35 [Hyperionvirus sp.]|uniref:Uncharacterized protein n=1 Tax=Hyperionvirus sp. TaxID=2487770 RepID=A0A3G5A9Q7_9VIRU|nr:MAG: hypothetical protein Hyperionvirus15_35 [Hyperionvirus sp.]
MAQLCEEAEAYVIANNVNLDDAARNKLATYDDHKQMQWLVNPMMMYCIEQTMWQMQQERGSASVANETPDEPENTTEEIEPEPDPDEEPVLFDLFG